MVLPTVPVYLIQWSDQTLILRSTTEGPIGKLIVDIPTRPKDKPTTIAETKLFTDGYRLPYTYGSIVRVPMMYGMLSEIGNNVVLQTRRSNGYTTALASEGFAIDISLDPSWQKKHTKNICNN